MIKEKIKFISNIVDINSDPFNRLLNSGDAMILNNESHIFAELNKFALNQIAVLITDSSDLISRVKNLRGVIPVLVDASVSKLSLSVDGSVVLTPHVDAVSNLFRDEIRGLLSLWSMNYDAIKINLEKFKKEVLKKITKQGGVYIFGTGTIGQQVLQECNDHGLKVLGFIDNNIAKIGHNFSGLVIKSIADLNPIENIVIIATGKSAEEIRSQLKSFDFENIINLSEFFYLVESTIEPEVDYLNDLSENKYEWLKFYLGLHDKESLQVLENILCHRLSLNTQYLAAVHDRKTDQWFDEKFVKKNKDAVFVDCGAYDGDTAEAFYKFNGNAKRIHAFEIDKDIASRAKVRLSMIDCAVVHFCGVADMEGKLNFSKTGITQGRLVGKATVTTEVEVVSIDNKIHEKITYLKLDVEGAEKMAIDGAKHHIKNDQPVLGIAAYHKAEDIWKLPKQINEINPNYQFYLRHYTDVSFETVIYGIVK